MTSTDAPEAAGWRVVFFTHHKCATIWLAELLSHICDLNGLRFARSHDGWARSSRDDHVTLLTNSQYTAIVEPLDPETRYFHVIRNPMSMLLSAYYSHLHSHPLDGWEALATQREVLRRQDRTAGILLTLAFLESEHFFPGTPGPLHALSAWRYDDVRIETLRMEDVTETPSILFSCLQEVAGASLLLPEASAFSFARLTGRQRGDVDPTAHFRSGDLEGWRAGLPASAIDYIRGHYAAMLTQYYPEVL